MGIKEKIKETCVKENIGNINDKIKIIEKYEFVTMIDKNDGRIFVGDYYDKDLYYDPQKEVFEFKIDNNYFPPEDDQLKEINRKYLILM